MTQFENESEWLKALRKYVLESEQIPPPYIWNQIESQLNTNKSKSPRRILIFWVGAAAAVVLLGLPVVFLFFSSLSKPPQHLASQSPRLDSIELPKKLQSNNKMSISLTSPNQKPLNSDLTGLRFDLSHHQSHVTANDQNKGTTSDDAKSAAVVYQYLSSTQSSPISVLLEVSPNGSSALYRLQSSEVWFATQHTTMFTSVQNRANILGLWGSWSNHPANTESNPKEVKNQGLVSTFAGTSTALAKEIGGTESTAGVVLLAQKELSNLQILNNWSLGMQLSWPLSDVLHLESGLVAQRIILSAPLLYTMYDPSQERFLGLLDVLQRVGSTDLTIWPLQAGQYAYEFSNWYATVPVRTTVALGKQRLQVRISAGSAWHQLVLRQTRTNWPMLDSEAHKSLFEDAYASIQMGVGVSYKLGTRWRLFIEPNLSHPLTSLTNQQLVDFRPSMVSIQGGILYRIQSK